MAGKEAAALNGAPGRLTAAVDVCTRQGGASVHRFFCGLYGAFLALTERNGILRTALARSGACGALASRRAELPAAGRSGGAGDPGTSGCREGVRITMGAGDAVFMKRSIFYRIVETLLNGHARGCIVIHGRRCGRWHGSVRCTWTHEGGDAGGLGDKESPWPSPSWWTIPPLPYKLRHGDRNTGRGQAFASRGLEIMRGGLFGCNTNPG